MKKRIASIILLALTLILPSACSANKAVESDAGGDIHYALINVKDFGTITIELFPEYAPVAVSHFADNARNGFYNGKTFHRVISDFMIQGGSFDGNGGSDPNAETFKAELTPEMRHYYGALCMAATGAGDASDSFYIVNSKDTDAFTEIVGDAASIEGAIVYYQEQLADIMENPQDYEAEYGSIQYVEMLRAQIENTILHYTNLLDYTTNASDEVKERYAKDGGVPFLDGGYTVFGYTVDGFDVIDKISAVKTELGSDGAESKPINDIIINWVAVKIKLD